MGSSSSGRVRTTRRKVGDVRTRHGRKTPQARSARRFTNIPVLFLAFDDEASHDVCVASDALATANVTCVRLDATVKRLRGYGFAKIRAVLAAPAREVLFIDADAWFVGDPYELFKEPTYRTAGAAFWPDFYDHFALDAARWREIEGGAEGYAADAGSQKCAADDLWSFCRADLSKTGRGAAAAATRTFRGDGTPRPRRG